MPDRDYAEALDQIQSDMAGHQRRHVGEVTTTANHKLAVQAIELLEKQHAEQPATVTAQTTTAAPAPESTTRTIEDRTYHREIAPDNGPMYRTASEFERQVLRHAQPRLARLMSEMDSGPLGSPSWRARTMAAMYFKVKSLEARKSGQFGLADNYERAYQVDLQELLEASNQPFGDWKSDAPERIIVSG